MVSSTIWTVGHSEFGGRVMNSGESTEYFARCDERTVSHRSAELQLSAVGRIRYRAELELRAPDGRGQCSRAGCAKRYRFANRRIRDGCQTPNWTPAAPAHV